MKTGIKMRLPGSLLGGLVYNFINRYDYVSWDSDKNYLKKKGWALKRVTMP